MTSPSIVGSVAISTTGNLTLQGGSLEASGGSVSLTATAGALTTTGVVHLDANILNLSAEQIGSPTDVIQTDAGVKAGEINATATYGGIYISNNAKLLLLTAAAIGPESGGNATNNIEIYSFGSIVIVPKPSSLVGSQPVGLYNPGGALTLYAGETLSANGQTTTPGMSGTTITSAETTGNPGTYYDVFTGAQPTIVAQGNSSGVSPSLQIITGQSEPQGTQPGGGGQTSPPLLITEAKLAGLTGTGPFTFTASSIIIDDDMDSNGQSAMILIPGSLTLTATNGPVVFLNPNDTLAVAGGGTITINAEGSNGVAVLGNLTTGGGSITVSAVGNIGIGAVNAGSGQVTIKSTAGSVFSSNGTALAISGGSTNVQGAGQPASASQSASLAELNATQAIATADATGAQAAAEQTTANAFKSELTSIDSQLTSIQTAFSNDQQNYQADENVVANETNIVMADTAVVNKETIAAAVFSNVSAAAFLISATTTQIATGLAIAGSVLGEIPPPVGTALAFGLYGVSFGVLGSSDAFNVISAVANFAATVIGDQQIVDSNKLTNDSITLATDQSTEDQDYAQLQVDLNMQTVLTNEYDATLQAYDVAQFAATNDQMIATQDQAVSGQAIAAVAATATPPSLNVNGSLTLASQANVLIPAGATIQAGSTSTITITGDTNDNPSGATVTVDGTLSAASALINVPLNSTGPDTFTITPSATTPITVTGGAGTDTLNFNAAGLAVTLSGNTITAAGMQPVTFSNIAVLNITGAANGGASYTLAGTSGQANIMSLVGTAQGAGTVTLNGVALSFSGVDSFNYQGGSGDSISVTPFAASGLPWNVAVTVAGGSGSPATLGYYSVASLADTVTPTGADAGTIGSPGLASVQFSNVGTIGADAGQSPGDELTVNLRGTVAPVTATLQTAGPNSAAIQFNGLFRLVMLDYAGLTINGNVGTYDLATATARLPMPLTLNTPDVQCVVNTGMTSTVNATASGDKISVTNAVIAGTTVGQVEVTGLSGNVSLFDVTDPQLVLNVPGNSDTINVAGNHPFTNGLYVYGNASYSDALNDTAGSGDAVTVTPSTSTISETGSGGPVVFAGINSVNLTASGATAMLTVAGSPEAEDFDFTPTATGAGSFTASGSTPQFTYTGIGNGITVNGGTSGSDQLSFTGAPANGAINTLDAEQTAAGTLAFTLNAFTVPFSLSNIGSVNLSETAGNALFEVGVAAALEKTPTESLNLHVVGSSIYDDHLLVKTEGAEPAGSQDVITPSGITGSGSVTVGAINPVTYQDVQSINLLPTVTVVDAGGTYNTKPFAATAQVNGGASLLGVKPTLTYYLYSGTFTPTVNYYSGTFTPPAGALRLSGAPAHAGTYAVVASFVGAGTYARNWAWTTFTISQAKPHVSVHPLVIKAGQTRVNGPLSGTATWTVNGKQVVVPGTFTFTNAAGTVLSKSSTPYAEDVTFTPTGAGAANYATVQTTVWVYATGPS